MSDTDIRARRFLLLLAVVCAGAVLVGNLIWLKYTHILSVYVILLLNLFGSLTFLVCLIIVLLGVAGHRPSAQSEPRRWTPRMVFSFTLALALLNAGLLYVNNFRVDPPMLLIINVGFVLSWVAGRRAMIKRLEKRLK